LRDNKKEEQQDEFLIWNHRASLIIFLYIF